MASFRKHIPSLNALVALEAAARHGSITLAAHELGVTQAAVSRQIAALEGELGMRLFHRRHRAVEPTEHCLELTSALALSFTAIRQSVDQLRARGGGQQTVVIGATLAFSSLWLLPRLRAFRDAFPLVHVRLVSRDSRIGLDEGSVDVVVRYGVPPFDDGETIASRPDLVFPVCAPAFAAGVSDPETFLARTTELIENEASDRQWYSWQTWFGRVGLSRPTVSHAMRFNHYTDALEAARAGQGVALGWNMLCERFLHDGSLVRLGPREVVAEGCYNVLLASRRTPTAMGELVGRWLSTQLAATG